ncbi:Arginase, catabolizes arginine to ornithine and urea [Entophlyctis luteolus]|nr:Arginase, catabolizes arginine to ornithine and urea [Entophlyctis luteolus]
MARQRPAAKTPSPAPKRLRTADSAVDAAANGPRGIIDRIVNERTPQRFIKDPHVVALVGAGFSGGQPKGGVDQGPTVLLKEGNLASQIEALDWKVEVDDHFPDIKHMKPNHDDKFGILKNVEYTSKVTQRIHECVKKSVGNGKLALTIGGLTGDVPPFSDWLKPSLDLSRIVYIGLRDLDGPEKKIIREHKIKAFSMHEVDRWGIGPVVDAAIKYLYDTAPDSEEAPCERDENGEKICPIHLSFDVDGLDPTVAPATGTPVRGGLSFREGHYIMEALHQAGTLVAVDITEVNPEVGTYLERETTISIGCSLGTAETVKTAKQSGAESQESKQVMVISFKVYGKVQGVFFRKHTARKASELGLVGQVRNNSDAQRTVQGVAAGPAAQVEAFDSGDGDKAAATASADYDDADVDAALLREVDRHARSSPVRPGVAADASDNPFVLPASRSVGDEDSGDGLASAAAADKRRHGQAASQSRKRKKPPKPRTRANNGSSEDGKNHHSNNNGDDDDDDDWSVKAQPRRRSSRTSIPPLQFWKGEHPEYLLVRDDSSGVNVPVLSRIVAPGAESLAQRTRIGVREPLAVSDMDSLSEGSCSPNKRTNTKSKSMRRKSGSSTHRSRRNDDEEDENSNSNDDVFINGKLQEPASGPHALPVIDPISGQEKIRDILFSKSDINPTKFRKCRIHRTFLVEDFCGAGFMEIPAKSEKSEKNSGSTAVIFYVLSGRVDVALHESTFSAGTGANFLIPPKNTYNIINPSKSKTARVYFVQARAPTNSAEPVQGSEEVRESKQVKSEIGTIGSPLKAEGRDLISGDADAR